MEDLKIAPAEKCPLCGGDIIFGECSFCGYAAPDTEKLSAAYDLSPDNVVFGDEELDDDDIPSISPPDTSVLPTAAQRRQAARLKRQEARLAAKNSNPKDINTSNQPFVPYTKPNYGNPPEHLTSNIPEMVVKSVSDFVFYNWWKFLLTAILPSAGYGFALFYFVINSDNERKKSELFFAAAILLTTILLQVANWDPTGLDTILQHFIMYFLREDYYY